MTHSGWGISQALPLLLPFAEVKIFSDYQVGPSVETLKSPIEAFPKLGNWDRLNLIVYGLFAVKTTVRAGKTIYYAAKGLKSQVKALERASSWNRVYRNVYQIQKWEGFTTVAKICAWFFSFVTFGALPFAFWLFSRYRDALVEDVVTDATNQAWRKMKNYLISIIS